MRALARDPSRASFPDGVETIAGDLTQPADWAGALEGVDGLFLLSGYDGMTDLLTLARDAGVRRAALLSSSSLEGADLDNAVARYHAQAEAAVEASGLEWTFLRPNSFMTNALEWAAQLRSGDVVRAPFAGVRVAMVDPADIAAVAATPSSRATSAAARCASAGPSRSRRPTASASWARSWGAICATSPCPTRRPPRRCTRRCPPPTPRRS